jgi:S1-C subfamily serine protease
MNTLKGKIIAVAAVVVIAGAAYATGAGLLFAPQIAKAQPAVLFSPDTVSSVYNKVSPAVVEIDTTQQGAGVFGGSVQGQGSGFVVDSNGNILTNNHVVEGSSSVTVKLANGQTVTGKVVGTDSNADLAVVKVDSAAVNGITPVSLLTDPSLIKIGEMAIAIGNPYGLDNTVTVGVVSGLNRSVSGSTLSGMVQTDAAINPGNSGGPLLDASGLVIGINTAIESPTTGARGIGFAVPSSTANRELTNLINGQTIVAPWLGISGTSLNATLAGNLTLSVNQGAYVIGVVAGSPAETAGLKGGNLDTTGTPAAGGDVITAVDGKAVVSMTDLSNYISSKNVGDNVTLSVLRSDNTISVQVTLGARPANLSSNTQPQPGLQPQIPNPGSPVVPGNPVNPGNPGFRFHRGMPSN